MDEAPSQDELRRVWEDAVHAWGRKANRSRDVTLAEADVASAAAKLAERDAKSRYDESQGR